MKKFKVNSVNAIEECEVIRETDSFVIFTNSYGKEQRSKKYTSYEHWFDTKVQCFDFVKNKYDKKVLGLKNRIDYLTQDYERFCKTNGIV